MLEPQDMQVWSLSWKGPLEEEMATHSSILAGIIPRPKERVVCVPQCRKESAATQHAHTPDTLSVHAQSCLILCNPMHYSPPGIFQARILEWVAISYSRQSFWPKDQTHVSCISCAGRRILYHFILYHSLSLFIITLSLCHLGSPILYLENPKVSTQKLLEYMNSAR